MEFKKKYRYLSLFNNFGLLLILASLYVQDSYSSYGLNWLWIAVEVVFLSVLATLFRHDKGLRAYCIKMYSQNARSIENTLLCVIGIVGIAARFFLPSEVVYYVQNSIFAFSILYLIGGLLYSTITE